MSDTCNGCPHLKYFEPDEHSFTQFRPFVCCDENNTMIAYYDEIIPKPEWCPK